MQILYHLSHQENPRILEWVAYPFSGDLPDPGIELGFHALQLDPLPAELPGMVEAQAGVKIAGRNINNLRYAGNTTLRAESEEAC